MDLIDSLLAALEEQEISRRVGQHHDEARIRYPLRKNTVETFDEFSDILGDYCAFHFAQCVAKGGRLSPAEAAGKAMGILDRQYRRRGGDRMDAFDDALRGTNGGLRSILDVICEDLKAESVEHYILDVFQRHVAPNKWEAKVEFVRKFISRHGASLGASIHADQPERYAQNYLDLVRAYVHHLQEAARAFRRL